VSCCAASPTAPARWRCSAAAATGARAFVGADAVIDTGSVATGLVASLPVAV
jgi:hypothetical protein